jgi:hypothetical protein
LLFSWRVSTTFSPPDSLVNWAIILNVKSKWTRQCAMRIVVPYCSIFHKVHEQNVQNFFYPCACKEFLQTWVNVLKRALDYIHQLLPEILQSNKGAQRLGILTP